LAAFLLLLLLVYERREARKSRLITKTILSCLFVLAAFLQVSSAPSYAGYLILGLILCLAGDVCLALPGEKAFQAGLVAFLLGHIFYVLSFSQLLPVVKWPLPGAVLFWVMSLLIFLYLRPSLKAMVVPVMVYILVITVMVSGAWAVLGQAALSSGGRILIFLGAFLFYLSDIFVARNQFIEGEFFNRLIGLPLYYAGQFLLAFSIGLL
jgi:uncharacterized membrane protein YhhN